MPAHLAAGCPEVATAPSTSWKKALRSSGASSAQPRLSIRAVAPARRHRRKEVTRQQLSAWQQC